MKISRIIAVLLFVLIAGCLGNIGDGYAQAATSETDGTQAQLIEAHKQTIVGRIKRFIVLPPNLQGSVEVMYDVVILPDGNVFGVKLVKSSGVAAYDGAVERAIYRAQPLPMPADRSLYKAVREVTLTFSYSK